MDLLLTQDGSQVTFTGRDTTSNVSPALQGTAGFATDGNPAIPQQATQIPAYHYDTMMGELYNLLVATGITPNAANYTQIYQAVLALRRMVDTGAVNALVASPISALLTGLPALSSIPDGFTVLVMPADSNTAVNPTFAFNGGSAVAITDPLGAALQPLDIQAGMPCELMKMGGADPFWALLRKASHRLVLGGSLAINVAASGSASPNLAQILSGTAFNSLQNARNWAQTTLDLAGQSVEYSVTGTLTAGLVASGPLIGQEGPGNELFSFQSGAALVITNGIGFQFAFGAQATIQGAGTPPVISASGTGSNQAEYPGTNVVISNVNFGACGNYQAFCDYGAILTFDAYTISAGAAAHAYASGGRMIWSASGITVTLSGTPAFTNGFIELDAIGYADVPPNITFSGSATGPRFNISGNSEIYTDGTSPSSFLPGNSAGVTADNSIYK